MNTQLAQLIHKLHYGKEITESDYVNVNFKVSNPKEDSDGSKQRTLTRGLFTVVSLWCEVYETEPPEYILNELANINKTSINCSLDGFNTSNLFKQVIMKYMNPITLAIYALRECDYGNCHDGHIRRDYNSSVVYYMFDEHSSNIHINSHTKPVWLDISMLYKRLTAIRDSISEEDIQLLHDEEYRNCSKGYGGGIASRSVAYAIVDDKPAMNICWHDVIIAAIDCDDDTKCCDMRCLLQDYSEEDRNDYYERLHKNNPDLYEYAVSNGYIKIESEENKETSVTYVSDEELAKALEMIKGIDLDNL